MTAANEIKKLISEGETQEAFDRLQELLEDKNDSLINQVYTLEAQFKEVQKKMRVGIMQESSELNRINHALLAICDDAKLAEAKMKHQMATATPSVSNAPSLLQNPIIKYIAIGIGILLLILLLMQLFGSNDTTTEPEPEPQSTESQN